MDDRQEALDATADELRSVGVNVARVYRQWEGPDSDELDAETGEHLKVALCEGPAGKVFTAVFRPPLKGTKAPTIITRPGWAVGVRSGS